MIVSPSGQFGVHLAQRGQRLIHELVSQMPIEALDECILHGLCPGRIVPARPRPLCRRQNVVRREFAAIVADNHGIRFTRDPRP